jgi:hypothetical protein
MAVCEGDSTFATPLSGFLNTSRLENHPTEEELAPGLSSLWCGALLLPRAVPWGLWDFVVSPMEHSGLIVLQKNRVFVAPQIGERRVCPLSSVQACCN